ncbi:MAG: HAMP domain-containing protein, partial [Desulfobacteraceae bacterium]|nr:HAMP domain-containing protein [Desulfobacteraceae bacterium]
MKFKSLYLKILLSFLGVLLITEVFIFSLFIITAGRSFRQHMDNENIAKLLFFKSLVQDQIDKMPDIPVYQREDIKVFLNKYANLLAMKIWISSPDGNILIKTFIDETHIKSINKKEPVVIDEDIRLFHLSKKRSRFYAQIPIICPDRSASTLHILLNARKHKPPEGLFLFGLLSIGAMIAFLVVPLTRIITNRIKDLNRSALEFAKGNLSCRTMIKGQDEITELGRSFNFMADKLEKMIQ